MKIIKTEKNYIVPDRQMLFDIETTGLSAQSSYVYLIGLIRNEGNKCVLTQLFCDTFSEEKELLKLFIEYMSECDCLISYNGTTFDIPYLNHKFGRHALRYSIPTEMSLDLYNELRKKKKYLELDNLKQNTVEKCAGFNRTDTFAGEELITLYTEYTGRERLASITKNPEVVAQVDALRAALLLHNSDDLDGLAHIFRNFGALDISKKNLQLKTDVNDFEMCFLFERPLYPVRFEISEPGYYLNNGKNSAEIAIPIKKGELKYFFSDYRNYTYIIDRDEALHSSVCSGIDKANKRKCKKNDAYIRRSGSFIPVPPSLIEYCQENNLRLFKTSYEDKMFYTELNTDEAFLYAYINSLL
ncbi:MAG: ribonuclease H-like domain-containing protein [Lachnospiraceae bacterium]|nr:ribonuclease H-like domain-containing protein [Lachnospiraceae bacterium]